MRATWSMLLVLAAGWVRAQDDAAVRKLRTRFDQATEALRNGDTAAARAGFEGVATGLGPSFRAGQFRPQSSDQRWVLY